MILTSIKGAFRVALTLSLLAPLMGRAAPPSVDLAAPGGGFENWQWFCQIDGNGDLVASQRLEVPFALKGSKRGVDLRWEWTGKHPFDPALVQSARGVIEPSDKVELASQIPLMRLEVDLKEGVAWRGIPVTRFASHHLPTESYAYFATPLPREEALARLSLDNPRSAKRWAAFHSREVERSNAPDFQATQSLLRKVSSSSSKAPGLEPRALAASLRDYFEIRLGSPSDLIGGDKAMPGLTKIGCFDSGKGKADGLPRLEIR